MVVSRSAIMFTFLKENVKSFGLYTFKHMINLFIGQNHMADAMKEYFYTQNLLIIATYVSIQRLYTLKKIDIDNFEHILCQLSGKTGISREAPPTKFLEDIQSSESANLLHNNEQSDYTEFSNKQTVLSERKKSSENHEEQNLVNGIH